MAWFIDQSAWTLAVHTGFSSIYIVASEFGTSGHFHITSSFSQIMLAFDIGLRTSIGATSSVEAFLTTFIMSLMNVETSADN